MKRFTMFVLAIALVAIPAMAQVQYGSITGTVVDNDGKALPGVTVTLTGPAIQGARTAVTDTDGRYRFVPVPPGKDFTLTFELSGFNKLEQTGINANIGRDTAVNAQMSLSQFAETVTVTAEKVVVDTTKSTVDTTVDWSLMDSIPNARWYQDIMQLAPGVRPGNNPYVNGGSNSGNTYMIDGVDTTDPRTQTWGTALVYDSIQEVQLQTGGFQAEYGRATGGILNLVTKSGGNNFSFTGRYVKSKADWSALNGIDSETGRKKSGGSRTDEGRPIGTLGGPIIKDALWFYLSYEERSNSRGYSYYPTIGDVSTGTLKDGRTSYAGHYFAGKLTWQVNPSHNVVAFYNEDPITLSPLQRGWYGPNYNSSVERVQFQGGDNSSLQWTGVLSPSFFMEAKYQRHRQELNVTPDSPTWNNVPYIRDLNVNYYYGGPYNEYTSKRSRDGLLLTGNYYLDAGASSHQFKAGVEYLGLKPKTGTVYNELGYYQVRGDTPYRHYLWTDQSGPTKKDQDYYALYVQDQWRFGKLTLNLGVRAESSEIFNNKNKSILKFGFGDMVAPRLGFAYDLNGDVIRGSISRFYEMPSNYISDYFQVVTDYFSLSQWNNSCTPNGSDVWTYDPSCWSTLVAYPYGSSATLDPNLKPAYTDEFTVGYEKRISDQFAGGATFVYRKQDTAIDWYDPSGYGYYYITNVPKQVRKDYPNEGLSKHVMEYQALSLDLRKRFGPDGFQFLANYTYTFKDNAWANNWRSVGAFIFTSPESINRLWYGRSNGKQFFKIAGSYTMPWHTIVGINGYWNDGNVYTPVTYAGTISGGAIPVAKRGSKSVGNNWESDLYVEQPFKFGPITASIYATLFNAFNNQQVTGRSTNTDLSTYGQPSAWQNPRSVQLGVKIEY